jgi:hypothetical protein
MASKGSTYGAIARWSCTVVAAIVLGLPAVSSAGALCPLPVDPLRVMPVLSDAEPARATVLRASPDPYDGRFSLGSETLGSMDPPPATEGFGPKFRRAWLPITAGEIVLLAVTAALPKSWTGWSATFVQDGADNLGEAWTNPPVMDDDGWFHNYVGHPYGGSLYYNSVRSQGASVPESFLTSLVLSTQWEYIFEAVAERPSIQDLVITPVVGSALGELIHSMTTRMRQNGTTAFEKIFIAVLNPAGAILGRE